MSGETFPFDDDLAKALADDLVPELSRGFADRVVAATEGRAPPLPAPRRSNGRWRSARRIATIAAISGALATAAAATGVLEDLGIPVPSVGEVWSRLGGNEGAPPEPVAPPVVAPAPAPIPETQMPVAIEGPIDTPAELEEAFRRIDSWRGQRRETRRDMVDQRIDRRIEQRREQGLPVPTPEQEEQFRSRIDRFRERREQRVDEVLEGRREELREEIEQGGELTGRELIERQITDDPEGLRAQRLERLRRMTPAQRREVLRRWRDRQLEQAPDLPPEDTSAVPEEMPDPSDS